MNNTFSYKEYIEIINKYRNRLKNIRDIEESNPFAFIRHDVEFSTFRAYQMANIELKMNVRTNYFFQTISNAYNVTSIKNRNLIKEIKKMGHNIGLHLYVTHIKKGDWDTLLKTLSFQSFILEEIIEDNIDSFAFHRPPKWVLENRENIIGGLINLYGDKFFEYSNTPKQIKYLADSKHRWTYGYPLDQHENFHKFQINMHPDEWTERGLNNYENFKTLFEENKLEFLETLDSETKTFKEFKDKFFLKNL